MEYKIIIGLNNVEFERKVGKALKEGWIPQGGVAVVAAKTGSTYTQAVIQK